MAYKLTEDDKQTIMDKISDIHDVIREMKERWGELYDDLGEICDVVKCSKEIKEENYEKRT